MDLPEYLNTYFSNGEQGLFEDKPVDLVTHFLEKFGVDVKKESNLYLLKYNMLIVKWSCPITHECRGIILRYDKKWEIVSRPWGKFWNLGEGMSPLTDDRIFEKHVDEFQLRSKEDGTGIQVWFDEAMGQWRASTFGTITPQPVDGFSSVTFADLFWQTFGEDAKAKLNEYGNKDYTYIFELCCYQNRIVTKYPDNRIYLLGIRHKISGVYLPL